MVKHVQSFTATSHATSKLTASLMPSGSWCSSGNVSSPLSKSLSTCEASISTRRKRRRLLAGKLAGKGSKEPDVRGGTTVRGGLAHGPLHKFRGLLDDSRKCLHSVLAGSNHEVLTVALEEPLGDRGLHRITLVLKQLRSIVANPISSGCQPRADRLLPSQYPAAAIARFLSNDLWQGNPLVYASEADNRHLREVRGILSKPRSLLPQMVRRAVLSEPQNPLAISRVITQEL